jgi:cGMP-dependent protein kinase 2
VAHTKVLEEGASFGEIALMYNYKRTATVKAIDDCETWALDGRVFKNIIIKSTL